MKQKILFALIAISFLTINSCKDDITKPITPPVEIKPGSRNYEWKEYILETPPNERSIVRSIFGASPNDIWAVANASLSMLQVWHFDGSSWTESGGRVIHRDETSVWGSSASDIWISNIEGRLMHFDGEEWKFITQLKVYGYDYVLIDQLWGVNSNEIYASGFCNNPWPVTKEKEYGVVFKYKNNEWKKLDLPVRYMNFVRVRKDKEGILYINGSDHGTPLYAIFSYDGTTFNEVLTSDEILILNNIGERVFVGKGKKLYELKNGTCELWTDFSETEFKMGLLGGRSMKDFFSLSNNGIGHYNGTDFKHIYDLNPLAYVYPTLLFEKEIFFTVADFNINRTRVIHGKLKEE